MWRVENREVYFIILAFFAEVIGTLSGVSSSTIFVPIGVLLESLQLTLALTACLHVLGNSIRLMLYWRDINWPLTLKFGGPSVLLAGLGAIYSDHLSKSTFAIILGCFLISLSLIFLLQKNSKIFKGRFIPYLGGGLSGFLTGILGSGGAVRSLALTGFELTPFAFTATSTLIDLGGDIFRLKVYIDKGYLQKENYFYIPLLMIVAVVANWWARKWLEKIPREKFKKIVLSFVLITGLISLSSGLIQIRK
ncbi:hypothetical protein CIK05_11190 [Bdellovibrio sp. qaytius]|nr:hypothetical protein CIK05_11190 [Bdellovibrio sp. qaytius]